jgi:hypothetical protein
VADNALEVKKEDIWNEIRSHPSDINFFRVDPLRPQSASPDGQVFIQSKGDCSSGRIQINLNTWALAKSSTLDAADINKLLKQQEPHYFQGILHPTGTSPTKPNEGAFIHDRAEADRHFEFDRPIPLCVDATPEEGSDGNVGNVDGRFTVIGRFYVTDEKGDCAFTVKTVLYTNGDLRDATLLLDANGKLSGNVKPPIAGMPSAASAAKDNTVEISDQSGQPLTPATGKAKGETWTDFRLQTTVSAPPFRKDWPLGFTVDVETTANGKGNTTLVLIGSMEIILEPQHSG